MSLRAVQVVESLEPAAGSIAICVEGLVRALREAGVDSDAIDAACRLDEAIRSTNLVHVHGWGYELAERAARTARKLGKPYVLSPLGALTPGPHNQKGFGEKLRSFFGERSLVRGAAALAALNIEDDRRLRASDVHSNIRLLPYGLFFDGCGSGGCAKIADSAAATSPRTLLMLGPIDPVYGCVALLKAFAELGPDADGWNVVLAGRDDGNWRKMLEAAIQRKGGGDRVRFADAKTPDEQRDLLSRASLLIAPSLHVRPAVSIMQAIASGVPAIASTFSAPPGLESVLRVCGPSRAELREALRTAMTLTDEQRRATTGPALAAAGASLDWSILAPKYAQLYREIA